jgi:integrase
MKMIYEWKSDLADIIQEYIDLKHQTGLKFEQQARYLRHFDAYHRNNGYEGVKLTKDMVSDFIYDRNERPVSHRNKEIVMRDFGQYLCQRGYPAYVPDVKTVLPRVKFVPHILTNDELKHIFTAIDLYPQTPRSYRNAVDPVLFRFLYGTGARISEALNLRVGDMDTGSGIATVRGAKNMKDRLLPLADNLTKRITSYIGEFHSHGNKDMWLFPSLHNGVTVQMDKSTAYTHFRDYLLMADIPHTKIGPRVHSFRHGFAVLCLKKWVLAGHDLTNMLPYLSAYMGHSDFRGTQYYLRLTSDLYPDIISKTEAEFGYIIPEGVFEYE